jgi:hypothetical protein
MNIRELGARQACEIVRPNHEPLMKYREIERMFNEPGFPRQR